MVELILIISILGVLTVITIPKLDDIIDDVRAKAVSERMMEDLSFLRGMAISQHDTTWLVVNPAQNQYGLYTGPDAGSRVLIPDPQTGNSLVLDLDSAYTGVSISSANFGGVSEVSFNWWGTPSAGGTIVLNNSRTLTLIAETGMAHETP
jgi:Tfp pilus assembly protein FimT